MTFEEKTISSEIIYNGAIINLRKDKVTVKTGTSYREIVEHNGGAVIIAVPEPQKMVMVKQFRKAAEKVILEVPAGKIDKGEDPEVTAIRELKEETGYSTDSVRYLTSFYTSVGFSDEVLYLYLAENLVPGEINFDENEALDIELYDIKELHDMVMRGEINDAKSIIAIQFAFELCLHNI